MKELFRRKEQFSIRKFTVGVASVMIGASLIVGSGEVKAAENKNVEVHYVADSDLTEAERATLKKFEETQVVEENTIAYYYVYKKNTKDGVLPNTTTAPLKAIAIAGTSLLVLALFVSKRKNKLITVCAFAVGMSGILNTTVLANNDFERFFENVEVAVGGKLPEPKQIAGYTFTGYYFTKEKEQEVRPKQPVNPVSPINPTKPEEPNVLPKEAKGDQEKGGAANLQEELPKFEIPKEAKGDQTGSEIVNDQPTPKDDKDEYEEYMINGKAGTPEAKVCEKDETTIIPFETITKEDPTLAKGQTKLEVEGKNGQKVTKVREFYTVSRNGEQVVFRDVLSEQETPAVNKVVLVGTKEETPVNPVEPTKPVEPVTPTEPTKPTEPVSPTQPTKPVEPVTPTEPTTPEQPEVPQPKFVTEDIEPTVRYEADESLEVGQSVTTGGKKGKKITTTTYERDSETGEIKEKTETKVIEEAGVIVVKVGTKPTTKSENVAPVYKANNEQAYKTSNVETEGTPKITTTTYSVNPTTGEVTPKEEVTQQGTSKEISVGTKPTEKREELPVVYKRNDEQEFGINTEEPGVEKVTTTTYAVDTTTGEVTPKEEVTEAGKAKVVTKGTKPKVEETPINFTTTYKADVNTPYNTKVEEIKGVNGKTVKTTAYTLDEQTGEVTENVPTTENAPATNAVFKVGNVQTVTSEIEITEREEKDKDPELEKGKTRVVFEGEKGETTTTTTYDVNPTTGELSNPQVSTKTTKEMKQRVIAEGTKEDIEKKIDFNDVTKRELFLVNDKGEMEPVTGFTEAPTDTSKYVLKLTRQNHKAVILPVDSITADGETFKVVSTGNEYLDDEGMTLDKIKVIPGTYTKFSDLINAIKADPSGTFKLASDMVADDSVASSQTSYIENFTGTLQSVDDTKLFAIKGLTRPLFNTLNNATIKDIKLEDLKVNTAKAAALAVTTAGGTIENVHTKGDVTGTSTMAGLVLDANNTKINKVSVSGNLTLNAANVYSATDITSGGIVGKMTGGSLNKALVDANISTTIPNALTNKFVGGVVGQAVSNATVDEVAAKGTISGTVNATYGNATIGGVAGVINPLPSAINMIGMNKVEKGDQIYDGYSRAWLSFTNAATVKDVSSGTTNKLRGAKVLTQQEAEAKIASWNILPTESSNNSSSNSDNQSSGQNSATVDYTTVEKAQANKKVAYENISKLLPFYDPKTIVKYGNKVSDTDKLATTKITSIVTMKDETPTNVTSANKEQLNKILVHYADGTVEKLAITPVGFFKDTKVYEYSLGNDLLFTPEQLVVDRTSLVNELTTAYKAIDFESEGMKKAVNLPEAQKTTPSLKMDDLFWKSTYNDVKDNIGNILAELLSSDDVLGESTAIDSTVKEKLSKDKEKILTGLSYISRLYDIHYGDLSIKNILLYHPEFYGDKKDLLEWLTSFSDLSFRDLQVLKNHDTYAKQFTSVTGSADVTKFLEKNKKLFSPEKDIKQWYKDSTKALVVEAASEQRKDADVSLYTWLNSYEEYKSYLLPLLNVRDNSVYVATNMSFITFGLKDRHIEDKTIKPTSSNYKEAIAKVEASIEANAKRWAKFADMWYRIVDEKVKDKMIRPYVSVFGGFQLGENKDSWLSAYDTEYKAMEDFFGGLGDYFGWASKPASARNGVRQVGNVFLESSKIEFVQDDILSNQGATTLSHEFVHAMDQIALLDGYKRRPNQDAESYAYGLLESSVSPNDKYYAMNFIQNFAGELATHNQSSDRFATADDLGQYMKGLYDVTYTLDAIEAENILKLSNKSDQKRFFDKLVPQYQAMDSNGVMNNNDQITTISDGEWNAMNITSIDGLIDSNLVAYDTNAHINKVYVQTDALNYYIISLASPIYAGFQNSFGTSSGLLFRKMAFDVLAAKGWKDGFIPFATNKLEEEAKAAGQVLSDVYAFNKVMGGQYSSYAAFKKAMYKQHLDDAKANKFKPITIDVDGTKHKISDYNDLSKLMNDAVAADLKRSKDRNNRFHIQQQSREKLKLAIIKAYHKETNDFRESIYKK